LFRGFWMIIFCHCEPLRIEYEGAVYHVTSRGNARVNIYLSDDYREMFLDILAHVTDWFGWVGHAAIQTIGCGKPTGSTATRCRRLRTMPNYTILR